MSVSTLDIDRSLKSRSTSGDPIIAAATADMPGAKVTTLPPAAKTAAQKAKSAGRARAAAKEVAGQRKASQEKIGDLAKGMTHPARAKDEAVKAVTGKGSTKAKPAAAKATTGNTGNAFPRITTEWTSAKGKDVKVKDRVRTADGIVIDVIGRWTKKAKDGNVPMVTGHIVAFGAGKQDATEGGKGKGVGDRCNAVAAEVTHVAKK